MSHPEKTLIQFLLTMLAVIAIAIFNWIKNRRTDEPPETGSERKITPPTSVPRQRMPPAPRPATQTPPAKKRMDWEEELRRILEGREPAAPPPLPPTAAPPPPLPALRPIPARPIAVEQERGLPMHLPGLTSSAQIYQQASQLDENVAERLRQITERVQHHAPVQQVRAASLEVSQAVALVRHRRSLRSVIMASVILGPPKALEN